MTSLAGTDERRRGGLWRQRDYRLFWTGETTSQVGTAVTSVALPLVAVSSLHASTFVVAVLNGATWLPWLVLGLPAGAWIDRLPRRPVMLACDTVSLLAFLSVPVAAWIGVLSTTQLLAVALLAGAANVLFSTAYQVYLPSLVDEADLTEGNAKLKGSRSAAQVAGPGLGGAVAQLAGAATGMLADAVSFAVSFACLITIRSHELPPARDPAGRTSTLRSETVDGMRFVLRDPYLRAETIYAATANLTLTGIDALMVVFLVRTVGLRAGTVGILIAMGSAGGVLGAILARPAARRWGTSRVTVACGVGGLPFALLLPLTGPGSRLVWLVVAMFVVAGTVVASNVIGSSFRQTYVPAEMLGRVSACVMTVSYSCMPVGAVLAGIAGEALGVRTTLWVLATGLALSGSVFLCSPMRRLRDLPATLAPPVAGHEADEDRLPGGFPDAQARRVVRGQ